MDIKRIIISAAVHALSENTSLLRKSDPLGDFLTLMFEGKTREQKLVENVEETLDSVVSGVKTLKTRHQFSKITKNI